MKTYKISFELVLKDTAELYIDDFVSKAIEEQLEGSEFMDSYVFEEIAQ